MLYLWSRCSCFDAGFVAFTLFAIGVGMWMIAAQDEYVREYAAATGSPPVTSGAGARRLLRRWTLFRAASLTRISRLVGTWQTDPKLEALRQTVITRRWISSALILWCISRLLDLAQPPELASRCGHSGWVASVDRFLRPWNEHDGLTL